MIDLAVGKQILQRHLHQHYHLVFRTIAVLQKNAARAIEHIIRGVGDGTKTSALNQYRFFVKNFGGLDRLTVRLEHHRICQALANQLQTHQSVIDALKDRSGELDQVHFDSSRREILVKR